MNAPTIVIGSVVLAIFVAIVARGIINRRRGGGNSSCACGGDCSQCKGCH